MTVWLEADPRHRAAYEHFERQFSQATAAGLKQAQEAARIVRMTDERQEFIHGDDGYLCYAPTGSPYGAFAPWMLRALADELDRRNAPHEADIDRYFAENPQTETQQ